MAAFTKSIGPCRVVYKGTDLGSTLGEVTLALNMETVDEKTNEDGDNPTGEFTTATMVSASVPLTKASLMQLAAVVPGSVLSSGEDRLGIKSQVGINLRDSAGELILKPVVNGTVSVDAGEWTYIPMAGAKPNWSVSHIYNGQKVYVTEFRGYPVEAADLVTGGALIGEDYNVGEICVMGSEA